ncbi:MAG TPA: hypothetical protein VF950_11575 [Planctomycetota bacterium]
MSLVLAISLSCLVLQSADRAVLVRTASGDRVEITDPPVLRRLEPLMNEDRQPLSGADWTVSLYRGKTLLRELKVRMAGSRQPIATFLLDQDRIRQLSKELADDSQEVREKATHDLVALGRVTLEPIRKLSESAVDVEVRSRAFRILKDIHAAGRPRVQVRFFFARKDRPADAPACIEEWIRAAAAEQRFPAIESAGWTEWSDLGLERSTVFPTVQTGKPGGVYVYGKTVEWTLDGAVTIEIDNSVKSWKSGRFSMDVKTPRTLIRLSDQTGADLFLAMRIVEER